MSPLRAARVGVLALLGQACAASEAPPTELMVAVDSDIASIDRIVFVLTAADGSTRTAQADLTHVALPASLGVVRVHGHPGPAAIEVRGYAADALVIARHATLAFVDGQTRLAQLSLLAACVDVRCADDESCGEAGCAVRAVPVDALVPWTGSASRWLGTSERDAEPDTADAGATDAAFTDASLTDAALADAGAEIDGAPDAPDASSAACTAGFADCNGLVGDGCEADLSSKKTCGTCLDACTAKEACVDFACVPK